jgi:hypothetical protein
MTRLRRLLAALTPSGPGYTLPPLPARGDEFEQWLKAQRDRHIDSHGPTPCWYALDEALNRYRLHAETRTPLDQQLNAEVPF